MNYEAIVTYENMVGKEDKLTLKVGPKFPGMTEEKMKESVMKNTQEFFNRPNNDKYVGCEVKSVELKPENNNGATGY